MIILIINISVTEANYPSADDGPVDGFTISYHCEPFTILGMPTLELALHS